MLATKYTKVSATLGILFTCFFISFSGTAQNASKEHDKHAYLQLAVKNFLVDSMHTDINDDMRVVVRAIDKRIEVVDCPEPYTFITGQLNMQQSNVSVKVECPSKSWYLFTHATVAIIQQVVVVTENLSPGTLLSNRNLDVIEIDKNKLRGTSFSFVEDVAGARVKRRIRAGNIIDDRMLCFVCKGDRVTIAAVIGGLSLKVYGVAEEDGVLGDTIQVRNISSDKLVYGRIASTTEVEIRI